MEKEIYRLALKLARGLGTRPANKLLERFRAPSHLPRLAPDRASDRAAGNDDGDRRCRHYRRRSRLRSRRCRRPPSRALRPRCRGALSANLAHAGAAIASGIARGVDSAGPRGALAAGGDAAAVSGCGVDVIYPTENNKLTAAKGLLITEFPMGAVVFPQNFPMGNRIISGMSVGVMVVEGAQFSGSFMTARLAMARGRVVFWIPGDIASKLSWAPNLLIKQGVRLVRDGKDVVSEVPAESRRHLNKRGRSRILEKPTWPAVWRPLQPNVRIRHPIIAVVPNWAAWLGVPLESLKVDGPPTSTICLKKWKIQSQARSWLRFSNWEWRTPSNSCRGRIL